MDCHELEIEEQIYARIAARKAMKWSWRRYFLESESSEGGVPLGANPSLPLNRGKESASSSTPRGYRPVGTGLLNKTLRTTKKTRIPHASAQDSIRIPGHHAQSMSRSGVRTTSENYGALPSSYKKLRKAKSMLTTRRQTLGSQDNPLLSPVGHNRVPRRSRSLAALSTSNFRLRLKQSLTTLRPKGRVAHLTASNEGSGHDEAVKIARAQFLDEEQQRLGGKPPSPSRPRPCIHHSPFRKSLKTSQGPESEENTTATGIEVFSVPTDLGKRSFSASLRDRLRKALGKGAREKDAIPPQQLEAQRIHFGELMDDTEFTRGFDAYCAREELKTRRHSLCFPSTSKHDDDEDRDAMPYNLNLTASRESLQSNSRSRVTSWTDSSMTGSVGLRSGPVERTRLSIIKEDSGPHQPSSSKGHHIGGVSLFQEPLPSPIDSQSVYAALIQRINQEEAEIERTRKAFAAINDEHGNAHDPLTDARPTIRVVHSNSSLDTVLVDNQSRRFSSRSCLANQAEGGMTPEQHKKTLERRKERLMAPDSQSSFHPFSSEQTPVAPSPFQRLLHCRRQEQSSNMGESSDFDGGTVVTPNDGSSSHLISRGRFGVGSESIYSRATDGDINEHYKPRVESSEELSVSTNAVAEVTDMAIRMPTVSCRRSSRTLSGTDGLSINQTQHSDWNPWAETLTTYRVDRPVPGGAHKREPAQIEFDEGPKRDETAALEASGLLNDLDETRRPLDMKAVTESKVTMSEGMLSSKKSHTGLPSSTRVGVLSTISNQAEGERRMGDGLRKLSAGNLVQILKKRSQIMAKADDAGKENIPTDQNDSPPMNTPGMLRLQFRNGNSTGRLRKRATEAAYSSRRDVHHTPQSASTSDSTAPSPCEESPSEKVKDNRVIRHNRPFDMDTPDHSGPFNSMYLGKRTPGHPDTMGNSRLSVAPCRMPSSDAFHLQYSNQHVAGDTDALPLEPSTVGRSAVKVLGFLNSKRMVSNFLKSRRMERSTSDGGRSAPGEGPAFI